LHFISPFDYFDQNFADLENFNTCHNYIGQSKKFFFLKIKGKSGEFVLAINIEK
jgi:hypothetical protein